MAGINVLLTIAVKVYIYPKKQIELMSSALLDSYPELMVFKIKGNNTILTSAIDDYCTSLVENSIPTIKEFAPELYSTMGQEELLALLKIFVANGYILAKG